MKKVIFLVSGSGSNMENLVKRMRSGEIPADTALVISNRPAVKALERAARLKVPTCVIDHRTFTSREEFDRELARVIDPIQPDFICLAGFMRLLTPWFVERFKGKLINIHPSYLPQFPGAHAIRDAFEAQAKETGVTIHFVDTGIDTGAVILQKKIPVYAGEPIEKLEERIHALEYELYPAALSLLLKNH